MQWMNDLKVAIIEKNVSKIGQLIDDAPLFEKEEIEIKKEAFALISEAMTLLEKYKNETLTIMQKIKQTKAFLMADEAKNPRFIG